MVRFHFVDTPDGPPIPWVPSHVPLSPIPASSGLELPTSLLKGEGHVGFDSVHPRLLGALEIGPTSLKRGEGPPSGSSRVVESEWVAKEGGGGGWMSRGRMDINHDAVDVQFELRSPAKITFDIGASLHNKENKNWIILKIL